MHFDTIQMINEATYEVDIGNIFCYSPAWFKIYRNTNRGVKIPEHTCTVAMNEKNLLSIKCIFFLLNCYSKNMFAV